jgi:hypothetical protein
MTMLLLQTMLSAYGSSICIGANNGPDAFFGV